MDNLRNNIRSLTHGDESRCVEQLLLDSNISVTARDRILGRSRSLVQRCRKDKQGKGTMDAFLQEFGLSNKEGVALMCLAEALLRVPDGITADRLIAEKIQSGDWGRHRGQSDSLFVNASTWGLMLTGKVINLEPEMTEHTTGWMSRLVTKMGEPLVRASVLQAMRIMGGQYVLGRTIEEGLKRGIKDNPKGTQFSFDMLGEAARTQADAERYYQAYSEAIDAIGKSNRGSDVYTANGISVKLSALHARYQYAQHERVMSELYPRIKALCLSAKTYNLGLSIDAEESERLDISLDIFEALARDPELAGWQGLGFVLQAYQKRAPAVAQWLIALGRATERRLMVRLVKGAYWDAEIKHAQEQGFVDYPVYTRKVNTDLCYQVCAERLLEADDAIYPQFATHNAYTACLVMELAQGRAFEFQRLHGMGHLLYQQLQKDYPNQQLPLRVYAPIGEHKDLLPYLVRRLLENGANSSFVNRFLDQQSPVDELMVDVVQKVSNTNVKRHSKIPLPIDLYRSAGELRNNAKGVDLDNPLAVQPLLDSIGKGFDTLLLAAPIISGKKRSAELGSVLSPADNRKIVGSVSRVSDKDISDALDLATDAQPKWDRLGGHARAVVLEGVANALEARSEEAMRIIVAEAGRTVPDALSEVREAVDFCRYYALQARQNFNEQSCLDGCGVFLCISPWNFPLAIFVGQVAAALAAGNGVLAKPAEPTPLIATYAVTLFHDAGVPVDVLHLLPGSGSQIGKQVLSDPRLSGVAFTGSTETAWRIYRQLLARPGKPVPLIAETGGQNAMIVDSTALPEQVVDDVIASAFLSAGQRCSALRVLYLQEDIADTVLDMLKGAMAALRMGDPAQLATDVGPVIDVAAQQVLQQHIEHMHRTATFVAQVDDSSSDLAHGTFVAPHVFEIDSMADLSREVFGPVLHVIRYSVSKLDDVLTQIDESGYGLTLGIHSRIEAVGDYIFRNTRVGNTYINRDLVGAVVGVNPFGGHGLSGTGPKAGGPNYLLRFANLPCDDNDRHAEVKPFVVGSEGAGSVEKISAEKGSEGNFDTSKTVQCSAKAFTGWRRVAAMQRADLFNSVADRLSDNSDELMAAVLKRAAVLARQYLGQSILLPGPTGEQNRLSLHARGPALCIVRDQDSEAAIVEQLSLPLAAGCTLVVVADTLALSRIAVLVEMLRETVLPAELLQVLPISALGDCLLDPDITVVGMVNESGLLERVKPLLAERDGAIIPLMLLASPTEVAHTNNTIGVYSQLLRFVIEKTRTDNLVATGGNTQLFNLGE